MSKKSRKRNKKILAAIGIGLGAAALASKKRNATETNNPVGGVDQIAADSKKTTPKKDTTVTTPKTIQDNKYEGPKNPKSIIVKTNTNKVYNRKDGPDSAKVGNPKSNFKGEDGYIRRGENATPMTTGRYGTARAASEMSKGALPPQLRAPKKPETFGSRNDGLSYFKSGGRVKGCGKALRGFGKAMKGNR
jgi:hypothetical protein